MTELSDKQVYAALRAWRGGPEHDDFSAMRAAIAAAEKAAWVTDGSAPEVGLDVLVMLNPGTFEVGRWAVDRWLNNRDAGFIGGSRPWRYIVGPEGEK